MSLNVDETLSKLSVIQKIKLLTGLVNFVDFLYTPIAYTLPGLVAYRIYRGTWGPIHENERRYEENLPRPEHIDKLGQDPMVFVERDV